MGTHKLPRHKLAAPEQIFRMMAEGWARVNAEIQLQRRKRDWKEAQLARQAGAVEDEAVERAENGDRNLFGAEKFAREGLHFLACDSFDGR